MYGWMCTLCAGIYVCRSLAGKIQARTGRVVFSYSHASTLVAAIQADIMSFCSHSSALGGWFYSDFFLNQADISS